jgi:large subunit ribosomal protein L4
VAERLTAELWTADGTLSGEVELEPSIFGIEPNMAVMHQVVTAQLAAARAGTHSTKTRGEVRGGGRKPWRQKGLGRARHGSNRSPQWIGGGVAHGPKPRSYVQRTPKKMKRLALRSALSARAAEGKIKVVEAFDVWEGPKTKQAVALLGAMRVSGKVLLLAEDHERVALMSFRNLDHVIACNAGQANTYDVLWADTVIMSRGTLDLGQSSPRGSTRAVTSDHEAASSTEYSVPRRDAEGTAGAEPADPDGCASEVIASDTTDPASTDETRPSPTKEAADDA